MAIPIIEPPQSDAPIEGLSEYLTAQGAPAGIARALFTKTWWLFFRSLILRAEEQSTGLDAYTIVFSKGGSLITDELVPSFVVLAKREGVPLRGMFRSRVAAAADTTLNMTITAPGGSPQTLFNSDITIPAGSTDPVFSSDLAIAPRMTEGYIVDLVVVYEGSSGGLDAASIFTAELSVLRTS